MEGKTISGYTLQRQLGTGGMAEVWYAENAIGKQAAVKLLMLKYCHDEIIVGRFQNEAKVMVKLDHPNIRQVYDFGSLDGRPCIVMEYLEGKDLKTMMNEGRHFTDDELRNWWNQIADALIYTHSQGIVHRDIKPSNLFLDKQGNIKLLDFGIAKIKESISMTQTGSMMGTLMYMSPEQVRDSKRVGPESDFYSLAVTFVHLISGKRPYDNDTSSDYDIRKGIVEIPLDLGELPVEWRIFLTPYLEKDPDKRPELRHFEDDSEDAETKFIDDKKAGFEEEDTSVTQLTVDEAPPRVAPNVVSKPPKNKTGLIIAIIAAVVALGVVGALLLGKKPPVDNIDPELEVMRVTYKKTVAEFESWNEKINSKNSMTNKDYITTPLGKLQEIERIENNPRFKKLGLNREFPNKLKDYRENLIQLSSGIQNEIAKLKEQWKGDSNSFEEDVYVKTLKETKDLIGKLMDLTKDGSVKNIDINNL